MQKLPIGIQTFSKLRNSDCVYIDKTEYIFNVINTVKTNFLSRPRRFGKSLTLSTIKSLYKGEKQYFKDLWIEDKWDWSKTSPIVHIGFSSLNYLNAGLEKAIETEMLKIGMEYGLDLASKDYADLFKELLEKLSAKLGPVVILIDEYDKPIIDFLEKDKIHIGKQNREILRNFYSVVKDADEYIEFFFMTGVSKFSQTGIFSNLNHLKDLTLHKDFVNIVGYTQEELEHYFADWLLDVHKDFPEFTYPQFMDNIKKWYNGYSWDSINSVYNPYSILLFLDGRSFESFWFKTGTPYFLIQMMKEKEEYIFNKIVTPAMLVESYDLENLDLRTILFQTGYLTIKEVTNSISGPVYLLDYPNKEVEVAMANHILASLFNKPQTQGAVPVFQIFDAFTDNNIEKVITIINAILKDVPNPLLRGKKEDFYHALVHLHFRYLGMMMDSEVFTSDGRMDAVVKTNTHIYVIEFKLDQSAEIALQQIKDKKYADKYGDDGREVKLIGINFDSVKKAVGDWLME
jgi:Predicted AAA-ATPase/PD-(D/E)XK nuclease superfamily